MNETPGFELIGKDGNKLKCAKDCPQFFVH